MQKTASIQPRMSSPKCGCPKNNNTSQNCIDYYYMYSSFRAHMTIPSDFFPWNRTS